MNHKNASLFYILKIAIVNRFFLKQIKINTLNTHHQKVL